GRGGDCGGLAPHSAEFYRGRLVHRPVARAADRGLAALFIGLIGTIPFIRTDRGRVSTNMIRGKQPVRGQGVIRQALRREVPLFLGYPFLQAAMGVNDECGHGTILLRHLDALPRRTLRIPSPTACTTFSETPTRLKLLSNRDVSRIASEVAPQAD